MRLGGAVGLDFAALCGEIGVDSVVCLAFLEKSGGVTP